MGSADDQVPLDGSKISAARSAEANTLSPPATSTLPPAIRHALAHTRPMTISCVVDHAGSSVAG